MEIQGYAEELIRNLFHDRFLLEEELGSGDRSTIFRAQDQHSGSTVSIKVVQTFQQASVFEKYISYSRQAKFLEKISHPRVARPVAADRSPRAVILVEEFFPGAALADLLSGGPVRHPVVMQLLRQGAEALQSFHEAGVFHRRIEPSNMILAGMSRGQSIREIGDPDLRLIHFGHSILLDTSITGDEPAEECAYVAPECFGMLPQIADCRADLYALGVLSYRLLTGRLPFEGETSAAYLHRVMATPAPPPSDFVPGLPPEVDRLVLELMARDPGDRPRAAAMLVGRLCGASRPEESTVGRLSTGEDTSLRPPRLVEREESVRYLSARFHEAKDGHGGAIVVEAASGDGKTRLVEELRELVESRGGIFLRTLSNEFEKDLPLHAIREVLDGYVERVRRLPPEGREVVIQRIQAASSHLGSGLFDLVPALRDLLPEVSELVPLDPQRELQRFINAVVGFFLGIACEEQPLVLFVDDFMSTDQESREILSRLADRLDGARAMLVAAVRTDSDPGMSEALPRAERIHLEPLSLEGTTRLLRDVLDMHDQSLEEVAGLVFERARGNVRLTLEIARALHQEPGGSLGRRAVEKLRELLRASGTEELIARRIERLSDVDRRVLSLASILGRKFSLDVLVRISTEEEEAVRAAVETGRKQQLLAYYSADKKDLLCFVDNAVQQYLYEGISVPERRAAHEQIGDLLEEDGEDENIIFEVAHHYLRADDRRKAARACLLAGERARTSCANAQSARFFQAGLEAALEVGLEVDRPRILEDLGDVLTLDGQYGDAERAYKEALDPGGDRHRTARLYGKIGEMFFRRGDNQQALSQLERCLQSMGFKLPASARGVYLSAIWQLGVHVVRRILPAFCRPRATGERRTLLRDAVRLHHTLAYVCYFQDIARTLDIHLRQLNMAERLGPSRELAQTYSDHGVVCSVMPLHRRAHSYQLSGLRMREELDDSWGIGQSHGFLGVCAYGRAEWDKALHHFADSRRILERLGDQWEVQVSYFHQSLIHRMRGDLSRALEHAESLLAITRENKDRNFEGIALICRAQVLCQLGELDRALADAETAIAMNDNLTRAMAYRVKAQVLIHYGMLEEALAAARSGLETVSVHHIRNEYVVENRVVFAAVLASRAESILAMGIAEKRRELRKLGKAVRSAVRAARLFPNSLGYALRVRGTYRWLRGECRIALADFERSAAVLRKQGAMYQLAWTRFEAGRWLSRVGDPRGVGFLDEAIRLFRDTGARRDLSEARELRARCDSSGWGAGLPAGASRLQHRQLTSLFKVSQTIASILEPDRLLRHAVDLAVEVLGAERGFILLADDEQTRPMVRVARDVHHQDVPEADQELNQDVIESAQDEQRPVAVVAPSASGIGPAGGALRPGRSILCVPLRIKDQPLGLIYVDNGLLREPYQTSDAELLSTFAAQLAVAIENAQAYRKIEELNIGLEEKVKERTSELLKAKLFLEKANRLKDEFLTNMSHELRTPLNAVIALSDILHDETFGPLNAKQKKYVSEIVQSGLHLLSLINDILDLSKVEAGKMQLHVNAFDLNQLLKDSLVMIKEKAARHRIEIVLDLCEESPRIRADQRKIKQVVVNLLSNAVKFTEGGGRVVIRSRGGEDEVTVTVADTGIGISREDLEKLFVEFQQIDSSLSRKYAGTGLGLALSRKFVELHGGRIWVESKPGQGSSFSFSLPKNVKEDGETRAVEDGVLEAARKSSG